ncbi:MAG: hypothetical protein ACLQVD_16040 [Capsulimonadaceae bacterium]
MKTLYATFENAADAEKAAGALFDHGVAGDDLTITAKHVSSGRQDSAEVEAATLIGENEGWPARSAAIISAEQWVVDVEQERVSAQYIEADHAERAAKSGISTTTWRDSAVGALKGSIVGLCSGLLAGLVWTWHPSSGLLNFGTDAWDVLGMAVVGLAVGATGGAATGYLWD